MRKLILYTTEDGCSQIKLRADLQLFPQNTKEANV